MTVSILWRSEGRLHLASDSRMSFGTAGSTDIGVKVMRLPIRIRGCDLDENGVLNTLFAQTYGGDIQYGSFGKNRDFSVSGITRISIEEAVDGDRHYGPSEQRVFKYRGFELYAGWTVPDDKFWPSPGFIELEVPSNNESEQRFIASCRALIAGTE